MMDLDRRWMVHARAANGLAVALTVASAACHRVTPVSPGVDSTSSRTTAPPSVRSATPFPRIPRDAARFEIESVDDSTARFKPREALWVKSGMTAYAVDPTNRDALVARLRVISVWNETAVAVVTSQVTRITPRHVVLLTPPIVPWWKSRRFWMGALVGSVVGGAIGGAVAAP